MVTGDYVWLDLDGVEVLGRVVARHPSGFKVLVMDGSEEPTNVVRRGRADLRPHRA